MPRPRAAGPLYEALRDAMDSLYDPSYAYRVQQEQQEQQQQYTCTTPTRDYPSPDKPRSYQNDYDYDINRSSASKEGTPSPFKGSPTVFGSTSSWVPVTVTEDGSDSTATLYK